MGTVIWSSHDQLSTSHFISWTHVINLLSLNKLILANDMSTYGIDSWKLMSSLYVTVKCVCANKNVNVNHVSCNCLLLQ